jgi:CHASE1-domain containing sensor protein
MAPNEVVTLRRWQVFAAFVAVTIGATGVAAWNGYRINQAEQRIQRSTKLAISAHVRATQAQTFVDTFQERIRKERVCTESNRGDPCRALFQRLAEDLSAEQRLALACEVGRYLQLPEYKVFCVPPG